jgi:hypothetical protein
VGDRERDQRMLQTAAVVVRRERQSMSGDAGSSQGRTPKRSEAFRNAELVGAEPES